MILLRWGSYVWSLKSHLFCEAFNIRASTPFNVSILSLNRVVMHGRSESVDQTLWSTIAIVLVYYSRP